MSLAGIKSQLDRIKHEQGVRDATISAATATTAKGTLAGLTDAQLDQALFEALRRLAADLKQDGKLVPEHIRRALAALERAPRSDIPEATRTKLRAESAAKNTEAMSEEEFIEVCVRLAGTTTHDHRMP